MFTFLLDLASFFYKTRPRHGYIYRRPAVRRAARVAEDGRRATTGHILALPSNRALPRPAAMKAGVTHCAQYLSRQLYDSRLATLRAAHSARFIHASSNEQITGLKPSSYTKTCDEPQLPSGSRSISKTNSEPENLGGTLSSPLCVSKNI